MSAWDLAAQFNSFTLSPTQTIKELNRTAAVKTTKAHLFSVMNHLALETHTFVLKIRGIIAVLLCQPRGATLIFYDHCVV